MGAVDLQSGTSIGHLLFSTSNQHWGLHYLLPGSSVGRYYVELLNEEINFLCNGTFPAEKLLVFGAVILHYDCSVCKGTDVCCLLDHRLTMWKDESFDVLIQKAEHCDRSLCNSYHSISRHTNDHLVRVFAKLMPQGNVCAAVPNMLVGVC